MMLFVEVTYFHYSQEIRVYVINTSPLKRHMLNTEAEAIHTLLIFINQKPIIRTLALDYSAP